MEAFSVFISFSISVNKEKELTDFLGNREDVTDNLL